MMQSLGSTCLSLEDKNTKLVKENLTVERHFAFSKRVVELLVALLAVNKVLKVPQMRCGI